LKEENQAFAKEKNEKDKELNYLKDKVTKMIYERTDS
jgi:hypothetical protein